MEMYPFVVLFSTCRNDMTVLQSDLAVIEYLVWEVYFYIAVLFPRVYSWIEQCRAQTVGCIRFLQPQSNCPSPARAHT
jgi:hypothetical protein